MPQQTGDLQKISKIRPSRLFFWIFYLAGILLLSTAGRLGIFNYLAGIAVMLLPEIAVRAVSYHVADAEIVAEQKLLFRKKISTTYDRIQDLKTVQGPADRLLGIGTVNINTAGSSGTEISMFGIRNPFSLEKEIRGRMVGKK